MYDSISGRYTIYRTFKRETIQLRKGVLLNWLRDFLLVCNSPGLYHYTTTHTQKKLQNLERNLFKVGLFTREKIHRGFEHNK